jgi:RNA 2',3'-cyclic 3'-phosphodiesterase
MRCFFALPLQDHTRDALCALQSGLRVGRPVDHANLHLTLAFLDEQTDMALEALHEEVSTLFIPRFDLTLRGTGCFGGSSPRVVFARADPAPGLVALHRDLRGAIRRAGLTVPRRKFQPHVTFARLKPYSAAGLAPFLQDHAGFLHYNGPVRTFALFQSRLRPEGAEYNVLAQYPIG